MITSIMQAYFFPYIGYFQLIDASDEIIMYEHVTFRKKSWITKNRILDKGRNLAVDIRVPVIKQSSNKTINEIEINGEDWKKPMLKLIYFNYKKAAHFEDIYPLIKKCINQGFNSLHLYNSHIIKEICSFLDIKTKIKIHNDEFLGLEAQLMNNDSPKTDIKSHRVIEICKHQQANTYINPIGGSELYSKDFFKKNDLSLYFVETHPFSYTQFGSEFQAYLSIIDVLMHNGKDGTKQILKNYSLI